MPLIRTDTKGGISSNWLLLTSAATAFAIFLFDLSLPLGVAAGVPYAALVLLGLWSRRPSYPLFLAAVGTILTLTGYALSNVGGIYWMVLTNRLLAIAAIWVTASLVFHRKKAEDALEETNQLLELRVEERTAEIETANLKLVQEIAERKHAEETLRESEARFRAVVDNSPLIISLKDVEGRYLLTNQQHQKVSGLRSDGQLGQMLHDIFPAEHAEMAMAHHCEVLETKSKIQREETLRLEDGVHTFLTLKFPIFDPAHEIQYVGSIATDITEQKRFEEQLHEAEKLGALGQLTGGVAHDFNNLLTVIVGNLELLEGHIGDGPQARRLLEVSLKAAFRGADLTNRLLAFSRKQTLKPETVDVNRTIAATTELLGRTLTPAVEMETVLAGGLWRAEIDKSQLENALINLGINARDSMPGGGKLTIETANIHLDQAYADAHDEEVTPGQYVMTAVTDTGTGMSHEVLAKAFDPFFTTKAVGKGTGLGLSMIYGFVKQSGGHVKIYSEEGQGTTVKLYLPRAKGDSQGPRTAQVPVRVRPSDGETILVVEDDPDVRAYLVAALELLDYNVLATADGPETLAALDQAPHLDMLLTDVVLPRGMNGREVADRVQARFPGIKILFTSGYTENAIVHQGRLDEDAVLLAKPYTKETLARKVREALDSGEE